VAFTFSPLIGIAGAAVLGGAIGLQRQAAAKPAGFRTHLLVACASAGFTAMGNHLHDTRIPSYVVVGIGFLGAGAIVRQGTTPHGLTTAASIWMAAAVGLAMGYSSSFGLFVALLATLITLIALSLSDSDLMRVFRIPRKATLRVTCASPQISIGDITQAFHEAHVRFDSSDIVSIQSEGTEQLVQLVYLVDLPRNRDLSAIVREISALSGVRKVEANEPFFVA
jgi:putative Mg2+ transporter-C (MgtC) family protein